MSLLVLFRISTPVLGEEVLGGGDKGRKPYLTVSTLSGSSSPSAPLSGPFLGYSLRADLVGVRPILGVPGAAVEGSLLPLGGPFRSLAVSSSKEYALGAMDDDGKLLIIRLQSSKRSLLIAREVPEAPDADHIVLSPTGSAAALYGRDRKSLTVLRGLPRNPRVSSKVSTAGLPAVMTALAVSDDGGAVAIATSQGEGGSVFLLSPVAAPRRLASIRRAVALKFRPAARDLFVVDSERNQVLRIDDTTGDPVVRLVAGISQGVSNPMAVEASEDGGQLVVVNRDSDRVLVLDLVSGVTQSLLCRCQPLALYRMRDPNTFGLIGGVKETTTIVRTRPDASEIFFVPSGDRPPPRVVETEMPRRR